MADEYDSSNFDHVGLEKRMLKYLNENGGSKDEQLKFLVSQRPAPDELFKEERFPLKNITPRFQLFSGYLHFFNHSQYKPLDLFGHIKIFNPSSEEEGRDGDGGVSVIFSRPSDDPLPILNKNVSFPPNYPPSQRSIPIHTSLDIAVDLHAVTPDNSFLQLTNEPNDFKLRFEKYDTFGTHQIKGRDGYLDLSYIILSDPVDAALEITFHPDSHVHEKLFNASIIAFYGDNYGPFPLRDTVYTTLLENGIITLNTSLLALPAKGYDLRIRAMVRQVPGQELDRKRAMFIDKFFVFTLKPKGSSNVRIQGNNCGINMNVNWKYDADTEEIDVAAHEIRTLQECEELETRDGLAVEVQGEISNDEETLYMQTTGTIQKKYRKKKKAKKKKVADEIHTLKECEKLDVEDQRTGRKKILKNIAKLRRKKERMKRMAVNGKYTEDDELELELKSLQLSLCKLNVAAGKRVQAQNKDNKDEE